MTLLEYFSGLLQYPDDHFPLLRSRLYDAAVHQLPAAVDDLDRFRTSTEKLPLSSVRELYTRTFDLMAVCSPYAGIHLYGEDNYKRGGLMAKLNETFTAHAFDAGNELPDHVAVLLRYSGVAPEDEVEELREYLLRGPVESMVTILSKTQNPYAPLLAALQTALSAPHQQAEQEQTMTEGA